MLETFRSVKSKLKSISYLLMQRCPFVFFLLYCFQSKVPHQGATEKSFVLLEMLEQMWSAPM